MLSGKTFDYFSPSRIIFESSSATHLADKISKYGSRFLLVNARVDDKNPEGLQAIRDVLHSRSDGCVVYDELIGSPDSEQIDSATYFAKKAHADCIIAYGSLDSINTAKAISVLVNNSFFCEDLIENRMDVIHTPMPLLVVPTEPTLGEELAGYFTVTDARNNLRTVIELENVFPEACFYDVTLGFHIKQDDAARIGGAMLAVAIEKYISKKSSVIVNTLLENVITTLFQDLKTFYENPEMEKLLSKMFWVSAMVGLSQMTFPPGINWVTAQTFATRTKVDHHYTYSMMLPYYLDYFLPSISSKFAKLADIFGISQENSSDMEKSVEIVEKIRKIYSELNLPSRLSEFYITNQQVGTLADDILTFPQIDYSPKKLAKEEIESVLLTSI